MKRISQNNYLGWSRINNRKWWWDAVVCSNRGYFLCWRFQHRPKLRRPVLWRRLHWQRWHRTTTDDVWSRCNICSCCRPQVGDIRYTSPRTSTLKTHHTNSSLWWSTNRPSHRWILTRSVRFFNCVGWFLRVDIVCKWRWALRLLGYGRLMILIWGLAWGGIYRKSVKFRKLLN